MVIIFELISIENTNKKTLISKIPALNLNSIPLFWISKNILIRGNGTKLSGISRKGHLPRFVITSTKPRAFESLSSLIYYSLFHGQFPFIIYTKTKSLSLSSRTLPLLFFAGNFDLLILTIQLLLRRIIRHYH